MLPNYRNLLIPVIMLVHLIYWIKSSNGTCTTLISTASTSVRCKLNHGHLPNCINPVNGTIATLTCNDWYEESALEKNPIRVCKENGWDRPIYDCHPMCGLKSPKAVTNIIGGNNVKAYADYPWQIGVYKTKDKLFICGGSIIESRAILSAAHCFANNYGKALPIDDYIIAAGKYYNNYDDNRDEMVQYSQILDIIIPDRYKAITHFYEADIAIIILKNPLEFSIVVLPVCINLGERKQQLFDKTAIVTGWGLTEEGGNTSEKLNELIVPIVPYRNCYPGVPENFRRFITYDKICAGYKDKGISICQGDSGGALVQKNTIDNLYYEVGIVSTSPSSSIGSCDSNAYGAYTSIEKHTEFISEALGKHPLQEFVECTGAHCSQENIEKKKNCNKLNNFCNVTLINCILPKFPPNGKYSIISDTNTHDYIPGEEVPEASELFVTCDTTFISDIEPFNVSVCTERGVWEPRPPNCARICPSLISSESTNFKCKYNGKPLKDCVNPKEGTEATLSCNEFYKESSSPINPISICEDGKWNVSIPECSLICGDPTKVQDSFPWHVGIYKDKEFICGGSIIHPKIILSAAQCFTDSDSVRQSAEDYTVAAGKFLQKYYSSNREIGAQYSRILQIHIPENYAGREGRHDKDIAIAILREPFILSLFVQPVCLDWDRMSLNSHTALYNNGTGETTGWGYTKKTRIVSDLIQNFKVTYRTVQKCYASVRSSYKKLFINDKICGVHATEDDETSVCGGDTGGGLVFYNLDDKRYYIKGIVSIPPSPDLHPCDIYPYSIYTSVDRYKNYLQEVTGNHFENIK